jgi:hypothetical protein
MAFHLLPHRLRGLHRGLLQSLSALLCAVLLIGCGGGGGNTPAPAPNRAPVANAGPAQSVMVGSLVTLDGSASTDPDNDALSYAWTLAVPAGSTATLSGTATARPIFTPDQAGNYAATLTVSDGKASSSASVTVTASLPPGTEPAIALDQVEPLSGAVKLSLTGTVTGAVTWYADLRLLGSGNAADGNSIAWNTVGVANGGHQILARIQPASGTATEVRRTVTVANSSITLSAGVSGTTGTINLDVRATSTFGITRVAAKFDGADFGSLTQPNACSRFCGGSNDVYRFTVDAAQAGSGPHTMVITATDASGSTRSLTVDVPVSNAPGLALKSPADGALVFGSLRVTGTATSDKPGAVTTTARLGDVEFLSTTASSFSGSFDLTGITPGNYTLNVRSTDSTGQTSQIQRGVVVTSSAALAYTPAFTLPTGGSLLAADGNQVLYASGDGSMLLRDLVAANEVTLNGASSIQYVSGWKLDAGRVVAFGKGADCVLYCVYLWTSSGSRTNLTNPNPYSRASNIGGGWAYDLHPQIHGDYVLWVNDGAADTGVATSATGRYTLFQISTGTYTRIGVPSGANYVGNNEFDFTVNGGTLDFWFWGQPAGEGTTSQFDIFRWKSDTAASTRITNGGSRNIYPQVDGTRAVWQQSPVGGSVDNTFALVASPLASVSPSQVADKATQFQLRNGVLAWVETPSTTSRALKTSVGGMTRTLSSLSTVNLLANGSGWVVYSEAGKVYSWNATSGLSKLRLDVAPGQAYVSGGAMVFTLGVSVYRVGLD